MTTFRSLSLFDDPSTAEAPANILAAARALAIHLARSRPLRLLKSPELLRVFVATSHAPHCNAPPQRIGWGGRALRVTRAWGPERIETGWWREDDVCRDYYRVEIDSGQHLWIFRCLRTSHWFLHGFYD